MELRTNRSFGGGYAALRLIQYHAVDTNAWLAMAEYTYLIFICSMAPSNIAVNSATFLGVRTAGLGGALIGIFVDRPTKKPVRPD